MPARITKLVRNNTQDGSLDKGDWELLFEAANTRTIDPLMGWTGTSDTMSQVRMTFPSKDAAVAFALKNGIEVVVQPAHDRKFNIRPAGYGENFSNARRNPWTH